MARRTPFATATEKSARKHAGRLGTSRTPLVIHAAMEIDEATRDDVSRRLGRKAGMFAPYLERLDVHFEEVDGPDGGIDVLCRMDAALSGFANVLVEERAASPALALRRAADVLGRTLHRALDKRLPAAPRTDKKKTSRPSVTRLLGIVRDDEGSLIDKRVGHAETNLEATLARPEKRRRDVLVDTAQPGVSASDRRAGYGATAARNVKRNTAGMQAALEDSRTKPSRKSTRRSANRAKAATPKELTAQLAAHDPHVRAIRERAHKGRPRGQR